MTLASLLDRCRVTWRPALLVCAASRAWGWTVLAWALALPVVALMARARAELGTAVLMYAPPLVALGVVGRAFALVRRPAVWTAVFARAGAGPRDLWRLAGLSGALALAASWSVAAFALAGLRSAAPLPSTGLVSLGLFTLAWSVCCILAVIGAAAVARRAAAGVVMGWMLLPAGFEAITSPFGVPEIAAHAVKILAPPLEAAVRLHDLLRGLVPAEVAPWFVAQLIGFPLVVLALFAWRARRIAERPQAVE
ncbi:MAG: hypothetical protein FJ361_00665 [Gemmatimonadetes bacterium]|nr:hypothetical protein [Gemmatimonadota bacterium]